MSAVLHHTAPQAVATLQVTRYNAEICGINLHQPLTTPLHYGDYPRRKDRVLIGYDESPLR
ncbi:hypothetical protein D3C75_1089610 [compost metagenome]